MAIVHISGVLGNLTTEGLPSKGDKGRIQKAEEPKSGNLGSVGNILDSVYESGSLGDVVTPSLSEQPDLYKRLGVSVENLGYFIIPRSVTSDPRYQAAPIKYQKVLHILFEHVAFSPTTYAIGFKVINIAIGQLCISVRGLADLCNTGVKFKKDLVDKNTVERASHFFCECGFLRQEVRHGKIILSIGVEEFYERLKKRSETDSETKVRQKRDTKEEDKELKEEENTYEIAVATAPAVSQKKSSSSSKRKKKEPEPKIERDKGVFTSETAHNKLIQSKGGLEIVQQIYSEMSVWKSENGVADGNDFALANKWTLKFKNPSKQPYQRNKPKLNHDTTPLNPKNSVSFADQAWDGKPTNQPKGEGNE